MIFFDLDRMVLPASLLGLHLQSSWACFLPLLRKGHFVVVNLRGCQFGTFPQSDSRWEGGDDREGEGCYGQDAVSWQCFEWPAGDTAALLLSVAKLLLGYIFSASLPFQE